MTNRRPPVFGRFRSDLLAAIEQSHARRSRFRRFRVGLVATAVTMTVVAGAIALSDEGGTSIRSEGPATTLALPETDKATDGPSATSLPGVPPSAVSGEPNTKLIDSYEIVGSLGTALTIRQFEISDLVTGATSSGFGFEDADGNGWSTSYRADCGLPRSVFHIARMGAFALVEPGLLPFVSLVDSTGDQLPSETWSDSKLPFVLVGTAFMDGASSARLVVLGGGGLGSSPNC